MYSRVPRNDLGSPRAIGFCRSAERFEGTGYLMILSLPARVRFGFNTKTRILLLTKATESTKMTRAIEALALIWLIIMSTTINLHRLEVWWMHCRNVSAFTIPYKCPFYRHACPWHNSRHDHQSPCESSLFFTQPIYDLFCSSLPSLASFSTPYSPA